MIIGVDIETKGLDATKFVCGAIVTDKGKEYFFLDKKSMWKKILDLGEDCYRKKRVLNVYGHNHAFDFYGYADLTSKNINWFCERPFIVEYCKIFEDGTRKGYIKFLDTMAVFGGNLKSLGEVINIPKLEMPEELLNENTNVTLRS